MWRQDYIMLCYYVVACVCAWHQHRNNTQPVIDPQLLTCCRCCVFQCNRFKLTSVTRRRTKLKWRRSRPYRATVWRKMAAALRNCASPPEQAKHWTFRLLTWRHSPMMTSHEHAQTTSSYKRIPHFLFLFVLEPAENGILLHHTEIKCRPTSRYRIPRINALFSL